VGGFGPQTWNIALNLGHWDTRSWTKPLPVRLFSAKSCKLEEEREAKDEKGYERFILSHFVLPSPKITRVENRPQKRMGRKLEIKTLIGWLWIKDAFAQLSASYPHLVFDLEFLDSTEAQGDRVLCFDHFCRFELNMLRPLLMKSSPPHRSASERQIRGRDIFSSQNPR
jgi:hypothetical protein